MITKTIAQKIEVATLAVDDNNDGEEKRTKERPGAHPLPDDADRDRVFREDPQALTGAFADALQLSSANFGQGLGSDLLGTRKSGLDGLLGAGTPTGADLGLGTNAVGGDRGAALLGSLGFTHPTSGGGAPAMPGRRDMSLYADGAAPTGGSAFVTGTFDVTSGGVKIGVTGVGVTADAGSRGAGLGLKFGSDGVELGLATKGSTEIRNPKTPGEGSDPTKTPNTTPVPTTAGDQPSTTSNFGVKNQKDAPTKEGGRIPSDDDLGSGVAPNSGAGDYPTTPTNDDPSDEGDDGDDGTPTDDGGTAVAYTDPDYMGGSVDLSAGPRKYAPVKTVQDDGGNSPIQTNSDGSPVLHHSDGSEVSLRDPDYQEGGSSGVPRTVIAPSDPVRPELQGIGPFGGTPRTGGGGGGGGGTYTGSPNVNTDHGGGGTSTGTTFGDRGRFGPHP